MTEIINLIENIKLSIGKLKEQWIRSNPLLERIKQHLNDLIKETKEASLKELLEKIDSKRIESEFEDRLHIKEESKGVSVPANMAWFISW